MMNRKMSNIAERQTVEKILGRTYRYPKIYECNTVINGSEESLVSVITSENPKVIDYGIWGMLPEDYQEDWMDFQNVFDTLTVDKDLLDAVPMYKKSLEQRRCLIIVTGFFSYHLHNGSLYPYHIYKEKKYPICLAGIYTVLDDGFITCSVITGKVSGRLKKIQNFNNTTPVILSERHYNTWLDPEVETNELMYLLNSDNNHDLKIDPIAKELFNQNISFDSILEPVQYSDIPKKFKS